MPAADPSTYGFEPGLGPLRPNAVAMSDPLVAKDLPSALSHAAARQQKALKIVRDAWGGTEAIKDSGTTTYLPKHPGEDGPNYRSRLQRSVFFNAFRRTIEGLAGLVFRKDPVLGDDVPAQIQEHWENIDLAGTHGDVFARDLLADALTAGHNAILVDYPDTGGVALTLADEAPLRPYWVPILKDNILSWRTEQIQGRTVLIQAVLKECTYVPAGEFGEKEQTRYRVLYLDALGPAWRLLEIVDNKRVVLVGEGRFSNQVEIPLAEIPTSGKRDILDSDPPLLDLAYLNLAHYQQQSDYFHSIHKTCVPVLFGAGITNRDADGNVTELVVGPNTAIMDPNPEASLQYVSHSGEALGSCKAALDDLKSDMATLGLSMLASEKRVAETAEAKRLDKATSDSALAVAARGLQDGIERALGFHARYLLQPLGGSIEINRDFEGLSMDAATMNAYASLIAQGLPWDVVIPELQLGGRIPEDVDPEELSLQMAAEQAAKEEDKREALDMQQQMQQDQGGIAA